MELNVKLCLSKNNIDFLFHVCELYLDCINAMLGCYLIKCLFTALLRFWCSFTELPEIIHTNRRSIMMQEEKSLHEKKRWGGVNSCFKPFQMYLKTQRQTWVFPEWEPLSSSFHKFSSALLKPAGERDAGAEPWAAAETRKLNISAENTFIHVGLELRDNLTTKKKQTSLKWKSPQLRVSS